MDKHDRHIITLICYDCGTTVSGLREGRTTIIQDAETGAWYNECPECDCEDFYVRGEEYVFGSRY